MNESFQEKENKVQKNKRIIVFVIVLLFLGILFVCQSVFFELEEVSVTGCKFYTEDEICEHFQTSPTDNNTLWFYLRYTYFKDVTIPFVDQYDVEIVSRNKIHINIYEKELISCIKYMGEYLYFDRDGIIIEASEERMKSVPLVTGLQFSEMGLYDKLMVQDEGVFKTILDVSLLLKRYEIPIDKIHFNYHHDITLYSGDIRVLLGKQEKYDVPIADLSKLLPKAQEKKLKGVLDMADYKEGQEKVIFRED